MIMMTFCAAKAQKVVYEKSDSIKVVTYLQEAAKLGKNENRMMFFAKKFLGVPYVGATLEKPIGEEQLVVNLRELDCTTFVETVAALKIADQRNERTFAGFCKALKQLRYRGGEINGYESRLHYFCMWTADNEKMGLVEDVLAKNPKECVTQTVAINYMTTYPEKYRQLKDNPELTKKIKRYEDECNGKKLKYVPKTKFGYGYKRLSQIHTGDILGIVTRKKGLDTTHLGIAVWQNGRLHLFNASSVYKKVVLDSETLAKYSSKHSLQIGIRAIRVK